MPTYQYACTACGHRFEAVQAFTDDSLTICPVCSGQLRKVYGSVGVVFKGSGFYRTDSRNGKHLRGRPGERRKVIGEVIGEVRPAGGQVRLVIERFERFERQQAGRHHRHLQFQHLQFQHVVLDQGRQLTHRPAPLRGRGGRRLGLALGAVALTALAACTGRPPPDRRPPPSRYRR